MANIFKEIGTCFSLGNIIEKNRKDEGIQLVVTKLIFPQKIIEEESLKKCIIKTLSTQPAEDQARIENVKLILLCNPVLKKTKKPKHKFTKQEKSKMIFTINNLLLQKKRLKMIFSSYH